MSALVAQAATHPSYQPTPKTNEIVEDLTFTFPAKTALGEVQHDFRQLHPFIQKVELKDLYQQNSTWTITYHDPKQALTVEMIAPIRREIVERASQNWHAQLVGSLQ
jgi:phenylalanyl-tRNA synthetase beta subunit